MRVEMVDLFEYIFENELNNEASFIVFVFEYSKLIINSSSIPKIFYLFILYDETIGVDFHYHIMIII